MKSNKLIPMLIIGLTLFSVGCKKKGCTDKNATNYDENAKKDDGSCKFSYTYYLDNDGDGLGDPNNTTTSESSTPPEGYVNNSNDKVDKTPSKIHVPIIMKITGETCYYCGEWGWDAFGDLANKYKDQALSWGNYGSGFSNGTFKNQEINPTMQKLQDMFYKGGGKPSFMANGNDYAQNTANAEKEAQDLINSGDAAVGITFNSSIEGDVLTIDAEAHFFEDLSGGPYEYTMAAYVIEDKATGPQSGPNGGSNVEHHLVMRGSMDSDAWGQLLDSGSGIQSKTFTATLKSNYIKENLTYGVVIWKKLATSYRFVNAAVEM